MSLGPIEIVLMASTWSFVAIVHFVSFIILQKKHQKMPKTLLLIYGIPVCYSIGCLLTPPDIISSLTIAVPCLILYFALCGFSLLLINRLRKTEKLGIKGL